ncbi:hypothetical protein PLESTB_001372500 [Pleodorina starrii]|uniref:Ubiquinol oxidase n=1 Tax=Pleodorina starrii TaxID=330485 RepID=A0A9W6F6R6_9CHLO|nr:hypothetical protein PLESTM_000412600 [Pleodorina starrii]GLC58542.1 hypothetical protein PLESTB_001372500 [Pleodorina starrii]GLC74193.1 hypothetical protein PLESTF_001472200 [Pleodorina starrii]
MSFFRPNCIMLLSQSALPFLSSLSLTRGNLIGAVKLVESVGLAAAHSHGAAAAPPSFASARGYAVYTRADACHVEQRSAAASGDVAKPPHERVHAPPTTLKAGGSFAAGAVAPHPGFRADLIAPRFTESFMPHPAYTADYLETVRPTHVQPEKLYQLVGFRVIQIARWLFDRATGYSERMSEAKWLQRIIFLETVAGVPGMVAGMVRHLKSLRTMQRDHGWIHTLLEEAENERMHLITFLELRRPGPLFRAAVIGAQGVFFNAYFLAYLLSPRTCHSFIGFLEEQAVQTYTHALAEIDAGRLWVDKPAPPIAMQYWGLPQGATMRDLILAVRADEACHAHVNHTFSKIAPNQTNPFATGASQLP